MKVLIIITTAIMLLSIDLFSQNNSLTIYTSYSIGKVDKRYDFIYDEYPVSIANAVMNRLQDNTPDDEYSFGVGYSIKLNKKIAVGLEAGYAKLVQDFFLPANGQPFFDAKGELFYWRKNSIYHLIQAGPKIHYTILDKRFKFGVNLHALGNVSFRKEILERNLSRNKVEYFSTEVYPGLSFGYWRLHAGLGVRALHMKYKDDAIANNGKNPDLYNSFKARFTLSYDILNW